MEKLNVLGNVVVKGRVACSIEDLGGVIRGEIILKGGWKLRGIEGGIELFREMRYCKVMSCEDYCGMIVFIDAIERRNECKVKGLGVMEDIACRLYDKGIKEGGNGFSRTEEMSRVYFGNGLELVLVGIDDNSMSGVYLFDGNRLRERGERRYTLSEVIRIGKRLGYVKNMSDLYRVGRLYFEGKK